MKYIFAALLPLLCPNAWACSCFGTASIERTIADHPVLVEAQVVSAGRGSATLRVKKVFKGLVTSETITVEQSMCYASLYPEIMEAQHMYILPLEQGSGGQYEMAGCAHSGLE